MRNSCPTRNQLMLWLAEQLSAAERDTVATHVDQCGACQETLERLSDAEDGKWAVGSHGPLALTESDADFVRRLKEIPPSGSEPAPIVFPGPPTTQGPLGQLGSYHIIKELGEGTFGVVYQAYDALGRLVALKILKPELAASTRERGRFEEEAKKCAAVKHDHVVTIYQVGSTAGFPLPYMVMEYVEGESLSNRLRRQGVLEPAKAATIVQQVAHGLTAAHDRNLIHRDLKPANILLERGSDRAKLADFGLARILEEDGRPLSSSGRLAGTPAYMSPEQIVSPGSLDPRSDVYSLGVVLYELLTGERPFRGVRQMVLQQVVHDEPRPPRRLNNQVPRNLETICLKAMDKLPGRRYETARAMADDLRRWLNGEPIQARPVGKLERAWRWCRRKPVVAGLAAALMLAVAGGLAGVLWQWQQTVQQRNTAEKNLETALEAVEKNLSNITTNLRLRAHNHRELRRQLLQSALPLLQQLVAQQPATPALRHVQAKVHLRLAFIFQEIGSLDEAIAHYRKAQEVLDDLSRAEPAKAAYRANLAICRNDLANQYAALRRHSEAEREYLAALKLRQNLAKEHPKDNQYLAELAATYGNLGVLYHEMERWQKSEEAFQTAWSHFRVLVETPSVKHAHLADAANCLANLGGLYRDMGRLSQAEQSYRKALTVHEKALEDPTRSRFWIDQAVCHSKLGVVLLDLGRAPEAERHFQRSLSIYEAMATEHPIPKYLAGLAYAHYELGVVKRDAGLFPLAARHYERAEELLRPLAEADQRVVEYQRHLASTYHDLGFVYYNLGRLEQANLGRLEQAKTAYHQAVMWKKVLAQGSATPHKHKPDLAMYYLNLGNVYRAADQLSQAGRYFLKSADCWRTMVEQFGEAIPQYRYELAKALCNVGVVLPLERWKEAERTYHEALNVARNFAAKHPQEADYQNLLAHLHSNLSVLYMKTEQRELAENHANIALQLWKRLAEQHPTSEHVLHLGSLQYDHGRYMRPHDAEVALVLLGEALTTLRPLLNTPSCDAAARYLLWNCYYVRADLLTERGRYADALPDWEHALLLAPEANRDPIHRGWASTLARLQEKTKEK